MKNAHPVVLWYAQIFLLLYEPKALAELLKLSRKA